MPSHSVEEQIAAPFVRHKGREGGGGAEKAGVNDSLSLFSLTRPTFIGQGASARRSGSRLWERKWTELRARFKPTNCRHSHQSGLGMYFTQKKSTNE